MTFNRPFRTRFRIVLLAAVAAVMPTLTGCQQKTATTPAYNGSPETYIIKHRTPEGDVATYTVDNYGGGNGCIWFPLQVEGKREQRLICGTIEITTQSK